MSVVARIGPASQPGILECKQTNQFGAWWKPTPTVYCGEVMLVTEWCYVAVVAVNVQAQAAYVDHAEEIEIEREVLTSVPRHEK